MHLQGTIEPTHGLANRSFGFDHHQGQAIHQQHQISATLGRAGADHELIGDDVLIVLEVLEINQTDRHMLMVGPERHRALAAQPGRHLLIGLDQPIAAHCEHDGAQFVENLIGTIWIGGDLGIEVDQGVADPGLDQDFVGETGDAGRREVVPAEAKELATSAGESMSDGSV